MQTGTAVRSAGIARSLRMHRLELAALAVLILAVAALCLHSALRVALFQDDEQQYVEQARYVAAHFPGALFQSGVWPRGPQRLDAWLMAIPFALMRGPHAFQLAHALQAFLFASTALPVFLTARRAQLGRAGSLLAAAIAITVPWAIVSTSYLAESAAYPAYGWVIFLTWISVERPSLRNEALLALAVGVAVLTRTAMLALIPLAPLAALWQEWRFGLVSGSLGARARDIAPRMWSRHRLLSIVLLLGLIVLVADVAGALPGRGLGTATGNYYGVPSIEPLSGLLVRYREYLSRVVVGTGFVALILALPWMALTLIRPLDRRAHATAVVCLLGLLTVLATLLNSGQDERYILYTAIPISLLSASSIVEALRAGRRYGTREVAVTLVFAAGLIALVLATIWPPVTNAYDFFTYPSAVFVRRLVVEHVGLGALPLALVMGAAAIVWALARATGRLLRPVSILLAVGIPAVGIVQLLYDAGKFTAQVGAAGPFAGQRSWVDEIVPGNAQVGALSLSLGATLGYLPIWRETEFWNASVTKDVMFQSIGALPTPMGSEVIQLTIQPSGLLTARGGPTLTAARAVPRYMLIPQQGTNAVGLNGKVIGASSYVPLELVHLSTPASIRWSTAGSNEEGAIPPGQAVTATVYPAALQAKGPSCATFSLLAPGGFSGRVPFVVSSAGHRVAHGALAAAQILHLREPLYPVQGAGGPHATISVQMPPGPSSPTGVPVAARLAFFEAGPCAGTTG